MEKHLSRDQLLRSLIETAHSPFASSDDVIDIKHILMTSDRFDGFNHLYLVSCYLEGDDSLFYVDAKEAEDQLDLALKERCDIAYYYQYLFYRQSDPRRARVGLYIITQYDYGPGLLAMGREYEEGTLFKLDEDRAIDCYLKAAKLGEKDAFIRGILLSKKRDDEKCEEDFYRLAEEMNISLPGRVR